MVLFSGVGLVAMISSELDDDQRKHLASIASSISNDFVELSCALERAERKTDVIITFK